MQRASDFVAWKVETFSSFSAILASNFVHVAFGHFLHYTNLVTLAVGIEKSEALARWAS